MLTMFYRVGQRAECHSFTPLVDDAATDLAEQAAADYWQRTSIANSRRPLHISLFDERGQLYGTFSVAVEQPPIYRATPTTAMQRAAA
ncbi:hypothetical protein GCM10027202_15500 [Microvirgula curvata]